MTETERKELVGEPQESEVSRATAEAKAMQRYNKLKLQAINLLEFTGHSKFDRSEWVLVFRMAADYLERELRNGRGPWKK